MVTFARFQLITLVIRANLCLLRRCSAAIKAHGHPSNSPICKRPRDCQMGNILAIGCDEPLLRTRAAVLRHSAGLVHTSNPDLTRVGERDFDLVVLCHSIPPTQRATIAADARQRWPNVRILQVADARCDAIPSAEYADAFTDWGQPDQLVAKASELLGSEPGAEASHNSISCRAA